MMKYTFFCYFRGEYPLGTWRVYYLRTRHPQVRVEPVPGQSPARWLILCPIIRVHMEPSIRHIIHICCLHKVQKVRPQQLTNGIHQIWRQPRAQHRLRYYTTILRFFFSWNQFLVISKLKFLLRTFFIFQGGASTTPGMHYKMDPDAMTGMYYPHQVLYIHIHTSAIVYFNLIKNFPFFSSYKQRLDFKISFLLPKY